MMLNTKEAADYLGVKPRSLTMARFSGTGCPCRKKDGEVLYNEEDLAFHKVNKRYNSGGKRTRLYVVRVYEGYELDAILKRRGRSFEDVCETLRAFPSFTNRTFSQGRKPDITVKQTESLRAAWLEFEAAYRGLEKTVDAILTAEPTGAE